MQARGSIGGRATLYGDTWRMAQDKLWFGWGMASYPHVFTLYNTQKSVDKLPVFYHDAHSDWLQAVAEHGLVGTALLALAGVLPLGSLRRRHFTSPLPAYLLGGCALVLLYAWIEFPFGNTAVVLAWWLCFFCGVHHARLQDREAPSPRTTAAPA
jgi:O-antigen ligase